MQELGLAGDKRSDLSPASREVDLTEESSTIQCFIMQRAFGVGFSFR